MGDDSRPTSVYRYYDEFGLLIYAGVTSRGMGRNLEHVRRADWWPYVASQEVEHFPSRGLALERESELIHKHHPPFNKQQNPGASEAVYERWRYELTGAGETFEEQRRRCDGRVPLRLLTWDRQQNIALLHTSPTEWLVVRRLVVAVGQEVRIHGSVAGKVKDHWLMGPMLVFEVAVQPRVSALASGTARFVATPNQKPAFKTLNVGGLHMDGAVIPRKIKAWGREAYAAEQLARQPIVDGIA